MKNRLALLSSLALLAVLAACASRTEDPPPVAQPKSDTPLPPVARPAVIVPAQSLDEYKQALAQHISRTSGSKVYPQRPQALLRSVVVVKYVVDAKGHLVRSEIMRSNRDRVTESIALNTLQAAAPFPPPAPQLLNKGRVELAETWLFNNDGRFQLRTIALPQMDR
ncbi:MAG TPA: TonB family protein [Noviherbaspirillum sp.]